MGCHSSKIETLVVKEVQIQTEDAATEVGSPASSSSSMSSSTRTSSDVQCRLEYLKCLSYISVPTRPIPADELSAIASFAQKNNARIQVTGVLFACRDFFWQTIEGPPAAIDGLFAKICKDPRHGNVVVVQKTSGMMARRFASWDMDVTNLDGPNAPNMLMAVQKMAVSILASHSLFRKYAPDPIAQAISAGDDPSAKTPRRQRRVLLFTDIMSFSAISEALAPARTLTWVNAVLCAAIECVVHHGGVVLSLMGDAVFASFDVDVLGETEACLGAVRAALAIQSALARMRAMSSSSADDDDSPLKVTYAGVGIHMGNVFVGNIGHKDKLAFTCMGNDVNVCARLEAATRSKNAWVLATDTVFDVIRQFDDEFHMLFMGHETFRNIDQPYGLYTIESPNVPAAELASVSTTAVELPKDVKPRIMEWVDRKKASRQKPLPKNMDAEDFSQFALQTTSAEDDEPMRSPLPLHELQEAFKAFQDKHRQEMRHSVN